MIKLKPYLLSILTFTATTIVLIWIFTNSNIKGSILLNNILWGSLALIFTFIVFRLNFKTVREVEKIVSKMANGDLACKVTLRNNTFFNNLCVNINQLIKKVRKLINESTTMTDKVISHCEALEKNAELANAAAGEINSSINKVSIDMMEQMKETREAETIVCKICEEHAEIVSYGSLIENMAISMGNQVDESAQIYDELIGKLNDSSSSNMLLASKISEVNKKIYMIQSIADTVDDISRTMHVLSINASIEASKAGAAGVGFAVVAKEVRALAANSSLQAREIEDIISGIRASITDISAQMTNEVEMIHKNIQFSNVTKENLSKIYSDSQNTILTVKEINQIIEAQDKKMSDIKNAIVNIAEISENTTAATQQISGSSELQLEAMENEFRAISNLIIMNKDLKDNIESFAQNFKITKEIRKYINDGVKILKELAQQEALFSMDYQICTQILIENKSKQPYFELFGLIDRDGIRKAITLDYTEEEVYVSFAHRPYFKEAIKGGCYTSEPYISTDTNNYCIAIAVPVISIKGDIVGVLMGDLTLG